MLMERRGVVKFKTPLIKSRGKEQYLKVFLIVFVIMMLVMLPVIIYNKGIFLYYGDFNSQQIPFYRYAHEAIRNGNIFWDWGTDLGSNFIGSYSFYLLGSPFFWLTIPFPNSTVIYLMPLLLALKAGIAGVTSYAYARRFIKSKNACVIAGILYALSGFQLYNIFFNHFHDVVAVFPLLLIALEERVNNDRRGVFALAVALCAVVNYFFFTGQITFLIIYFVCRCTSNDFHINLRKFFGLMIESVLGVMLACFLLLPSALAITDNPRVDQKLYGLDMIVYSDKFRLFRIIQSFFMLPDPPARANLFSSTTARWASIAGYLPLFSMAGVIAFFKGKKKNWMKKVITICIICAFIPVLNTSFYAFNSSYYARWYYMPILIMCVMTAYVLDNRRMRLSRGVPICIAVVAFFALSALLPIQDPKVEGVLDYGNLATYKDLFWISIAVTTAGLLMLLYVAYASERNKYFFRRATILTTLAALLCTGAIVWYGAAQGPYPNTYINEAIKGKNNISLDTGKDFFRVDMSDSTDNYPMFWGYSSMRTFHSVVPPSIMEFYDGLGITRDVASRVPVERYPLRSLLSTKYYFNRKNEKPITMDGFELISTQNNFDIYENKYYIPMGFTFDYYITKEQFETKGGASRDRLLLKGLLLDYFQIMRYRDIIKPLPQADADSVYDNSGFAEDCLQRKATSAYYFKKDTKGFTAKINLDKENLVFFSVPYDKGFTAKVNGVETRIEKVDNGLMAVYCPEGKDIEIRFDYRPRGLTEGIIISFTGLVLLIAYVIVGKKLIKKQAFGREYDYVSFEEKLAQNKAADPVEPAEDKKD